MKKTILTLLLIMLAMTVGAASGFSAGYKAEISNVDLSIDYDSSTIEIECESNGNPEYDVLTVKVCDEDNNVINISDLCDYNRSGEITISVKVVNPPIMSKSYTVYFGGDFKPANKSILYRNDLYKKSIIDRLALKTSVSDFSTLLFDNSERLALDITDVNKNESLKQSVADALFAKRASMTAENYYNMYREQLILSQITVTGSSVLESEKFSSYEDLFAISLGKDSFYSRLSDKKSVFEKIKSATSFEKLKEAFLEAVMVESYSYINRSECEAFVYEFKSKLSESTVNAYNSLSQSNKTQAAINFCGRSLETSSQLSSALEEAVRTVTEQKSTLSGSGGGGGGTTRVNASQTSTPSSVEINQTSENSYYDDIYKAVWAKEAIIYLTDKGIMNGNGNREFNPDKLLTREEAVKILSLAFDTYYSNISEAATCGFADVSKESWAYPYIVSAAAGGYINGVDKNHFGLKTPITREDICVMILRFARSVELKKPAMNFTDNDEISEYAFEAVFNLQKSGAVNGFEDGSFRPKDGCTRAMAAVMLYNLIK